MGEIILIIVILGALYYTFRRSRNGGDTSIGETRITSKALKKGKHTVDVVGESYPNDDGSSRQDILSKVAPGDEVQLNLYDYKGEWAVGVIVDGKMIGNLPHGYGKKVFNAVSKELEFEAYLESVGKSSESGLYGAVVTIIVS